MNMMTTPSSIKADAKTTKEDSGGLQSMLSRFRFRANKAGKSKAFAKKMPGPLVLTGSAVKKVKQLIDEEGNPALKLRVFIQGGGCSGYQYGFTFDEAIDKDDMVLYFPVEEKIAEDEIIVGFSFAEDNGEEATDDEDEDEEDEDDEEDDDDYDSRFSNEKEVLSTSQKDFQLLVDSFSYHYLVGAQIDYKDDITGAQFVIKNPNATTTCGCGSSFSV